MVRPLRLGILLAAIAAPGGAATYQLAVDVPAALGAVEPLPNQVVVSGAGGYSLATTLDPSVAISALDLRPDGRWAFVPAHGAVLGGVLRGPRDVVAWDGASYGLLLDGAAAGIPEGARIDALLRHPATGALVVSLDVPATLGGVDRSPADLVVADGAFSLYWGGASAGVPAGANLVGADVDATGLLVVTFDVPVSLDGTEYLPGQLVAVSGGFTSYHVDPAWSRSVELRDFGFLPAAGTVPDGAFVPGTPLHLSRAGGGIALSWGASCASADVDYEVYEGTLGSWYSHAPVQCSTGGALSTALPMPAGLTYYLVVPRNAFSEGSYGRRSSGVERPVGVSVCASQAVRSCP